MIAASSQQAAPRTASVGEDPLAGVGLRGFAQRFRRGEMSSEQATRAYLDRIATFDRRIGSYSAVDDAWAMEAACAIDKSRDRGADFGPLMGVPVAVKEIFEIEGLPFGAGTDTDVADFKPREGPFIRRLRGQGAVVLGLTRTTEFAAAPMNLSRSGAWNPWDAATKRVCGGSSHGSAAAMAAGMCGMAVGTDSGGSVRLPAALCGTVGLKPSKGWCSNEGIFPLAPTFDTVGLFARSVEDAAFSFAALSGRPIDDRKASKPIRLARPACCFDGLDGPVQVAVEQACRQLSAAGADIIGIELPCFEQALQLHARLLVNELVLYLGRARLIENRHRLDPVTWSRVEPELGATREAAEHLKRRASQLIADFKSNTAGFDGVLTPTTPISPGPVSDLDTLAKVVAWNGHANRNTRPGNLFDQCGISLPLPDAGAVPVGLQLLLPRGCDVALLNLARFVEGIVGPGRAPDLAGFVEHRSGNSGL